MGRVVSDYVSDHTLWINQQLAKHPEWEEDQRKGRAIWWDRPRTAEEIKSAEASTVPQRPYPYDNQF